MTSQTPAFRRLALALALGTSTALVGTLSFADEAQAQRARTAGKPEAAEKESNKKSGKAAKSPFSKEFLALLQPLDAAIRQPNADIAALQPQFDALLAAAVAPAERAESGVLLFNAGIYAQDAALQLKGAETALQSGNLNPNETARFSFLAYQSARSLNDFARARPYLQAAIDGGYTDPNLTESDLLYRVVDLDFKEGRYREGLATLTRAIETRKAAGLEVPAGWYGTGVRTALDNTVVPEIYDFMELWIADNPSKSVWKDSVNIVRRLNNYEDRGSEEVMLDLMRLARNIGTMETAQDYLTYLEVTRATRYPQEFKDVASKGYASGAVARSDSWVAEQLGIAEKIIPIDLAELDKDIAKAQTSTKSEEVLLSARKLLSYGRYDVSAKLFTRALDMPGTPRNEALQRLGMAQVGMGDYDAAVATFNQVDGTRAPVARLWAAYALQRKKGVDVVS